MTTSNTEPLTVSSIFRVLDPEFVKTHETMVKTTTDVVRESAAQRRRSANDVAKYRECVRESNRIRAEIRLRSGGKLC